MAASQNLSRLAVFSLLMTLIDVLVNIASVLVPTWFFTLIDEANGVELEPVEDAFKGFN